MLAAHQN